MWTARPPRRRGGGRPDPAHPNTEIIWGRYYRPPYDPNRPSADQVSLDPDGSRAPYHPNGNVDLYSRAVLHFPRLRENNVFQGPTNVFDGTIQVRRCVVLSDPAAKEALRPLDPAASADLVRRLVPHAYRLDGRAAAGLRTDDPALPRDYVHGAAVDYHSLLAGHLWAAVRRGRPPAARPPPQELQARVSHLEGKEMDADAAPARRSRLGLHRRGDGARLRRADPHRGAPGGPGD